jgi:PH (Pleckstrin Homology) domain-containing protein
MADEGEVVCRVGRRRTGWVCVGVGAAGAVAAAVGLAAQGAGEWQGVCLGLGVLGLVSLGLLLSEVRADADGLRVRSVLRRRSVPWSEVDDLRVRMRQPGTNHVRRVRLTLRGGRTLPLPLPLAMGADPDFDAQLDALRALHRRYGSPSSDHVHVVSSRTAGRGVLLPASLLAVFLASAGLAFWLVPVTVAHAQAWDAASPCTSATPVAQRRECVSTVPAVIARTDPNGLDSRSWLYFADRRPERRVAVTQAAAQAFAPGDKVELSLWRGEVRKVAGTHHVWREHVPAGGDAAAVAAALLLAAGFPAAQLLLRLRGRRLPDDDVLPTVLPFAVVLAVTGCWLLPLCHRYPAAPPTSTGGVTWAVAGSLVSLALLAWAWRATRIRRPGKDAATPFASAAVAQDDTEVILPARFLDKTDYNPFGNFGTHVVLGGGEPPAVLPHGGPGRFAARAIPVQRLTLQDVRRPRGDDGEEVPRNWHVAVLDDAGTPVRLAASPADLPRILATVAPAAARPRAHSARGLGDGTDLRR